MKIVSKSVALPIGPYSQAVVAGDFLFVSGQGGVDIEGRVVLGGIGKQTEQIMLNLQEIFKEAGTNFSSVVKTTCYLKNMKDFQIFNEIYRKYFSTLPARSCIAVKDLPLDLLCEVEVVAYLSKNKSIEGL